MEVNVIKNVTARNVPESLTEFFKICCNGRIGLNITGIKDTRQSDLTVFSNLLMGIRGTSGVSGTEWISVSLAMPFLMMIFLMVIFMVYNLFCKMKLSEEVATPNNLPTVRPGSSPIYDLNLAAPRTPPPSYSILISNGDSLFTPPSYRMLFPLESNISSSFEDFTFSSNVLINLEDEMFGNLPRNILHDRELGEEM